MTTMLPPGVSLGDSEPGAILSTSEEVPLLDAKTKPVKAETKD